MAVLDILQFGDDILREKSTEVADFNEELWELLDDMAETMYEAGGVGLAAPQVGVLKRVVVIDTDDDHGLPQCEPDIEVEIITEDITLENCHLDADIDEEATPMPDDPEPADLGNEDLTADL